ncbi:MAG: hypothetical protein ACI4CC_01535 [Lachnospiraceae bacterium]
MNNGIDLQSMEPNKIYATKSMHIGCVRPELFTRSKCYWIWYRDQAHDDQFTTMRGFTDPVRTVKLINEEMTKNAEQFTDYYHTYITLARWHNVTGDGMLKNRVFLEMIDYLNTVDNAENHVGYGMHNSNSPLMLDFFGVKNLDRRPCPLDDQPVKFGHHDYLDAADQTLTAYIKEQGDEVDPLRNGNYLLRQVEVKNQNGQRAGFIVSGLVKILPEGEYDVKSYTLLLKNNL